MLKKIKCLNKCFDRNKQKFMKIFEQWLMKKQLLANIDSNDPTKTLRSKIILFLLILMKVEGGC